MRTLAWLLLTFALLQARAEETPKPSETVLTVAGDVGTALHLTLTDLRAMPRTTLTARDHNGDDHVYEGVLFSELLKRAQVPLGDELRGPALSTYVVVKAVDNYQAVFSLAELDPAMNTNQALVVDRTDGRNVLHFQGPIRLVISGDKRFARWVRQVTEIQVVRLPVPPKKETP